MQPGKRIGVWVVEKALGRGGMGTVYRCHNADAQRILAAVKLLGPGLQHHPESQARFVREAEILYSLDHPNIVKVRNVHLHASPPYLEMEFVSGESLESLLARRGALPLRDALTLGEQLLSAVYYLHKKGTFHRDIKPANLVIRKGDGVLKVVDFGLAMEVAGDRITNQGAAFGTVSYAPPEWLEPAKLEPGAWDLYASGVVLYEMLTGAVGFPVDPTMGPRQQALDVMATKRRTECLDPGVRFQDDLRLLVRDMTARDPSARPQSPREALRRLQGLERGYESEGMVTVLGTEGDLRAAAMSVPMPPQRPLVTPTPGPSVRNEAGSGRRRPSVEEEAPADVPAPVDPSLPTGGGAGPSWGYAALGIAVLALLLAVGVLGVALFLVIGAGPDLRDVEVVVTGHGEADHIGVRLGELPSTSRDGFTYRFSRVPLGDTNVRWVVGPGCPSLDCPGDGCEPWCLTGETARAIKGGEGVQLVAVEVARVAARTVTVAVVPEGHSELRGTLSGIDGEKVEGGLSFVVLPGRHALVLVSGQCEADAIGCANRGACPPGCSSWQEELTVGVGGEALEHPVTLALPVPPQSKPPRVGGGAAVVTPPTPPPPAGVTPTVPSSVTSGALVTRGQFQAFVDGHPQWSQAQAIADGRADKHYLKWQDGRGDQAPAVDVSWWAAAAFCAGRGGLADADASPLRWDEQNPELPYTVWRQRDLQAVWRRADGETSKRFERAQTSGFTGFRCAR